MKVLGQLKDACLELLGVAPSTNTQGRVYYDTSKGQAVIDKGTAKRAFLVNDDKLVIGNAATAAQNVKVNSTATTQVQFLKGDDVTPEGLVSNNLATVSAKHETFADSLKPLAGNAGRVAYISDLATLKVDTGSSWIPVGAVRQTRDVTASTTMLATDEVLLVDASAGDVTITLLSASLVKGKKISIKRVDSTANGNLVFVSGAGFPGGSGLMSTTINLYNVPFSRNESVTLISTGSAWVVDAHHFYNDTQSGSALRIDVSSNGASQPGQYVKGYTIDEKFVAQRTGKFLSVDWYRDPLPVLTSVGQGDYIFTLYCTYVSLDRFLLDSNLVSGYNGAETTGQFVFKSTVGTCMSSQSTSVSPFMGAAVLYTGNTVAFRMAGLDRTNSPGYGYVGAGYYDFSVQSRIYSASFKVPIANWLG